MIGENKAEYLSIHLQHQVIDTMVRFPVRIILLIRMTAAQIKLLLLPPPSLSSSS
jgi:hypothetical protein